MTKVQAELDETKIILVSGGRGECILELGGRGALMQMLCWKGGCPPLSKRPRPQSQTAQVTLSLCCLHPSGFNTLVARWPHLRPGVALIPPRCNGLRSAALLPCTAAPRGLPPKPSRCLPRRV